MPALFDALASTMVRLERPNCDFLHSYERPAKGPMIDGTLLDTRVHHSRINDNDMSEKNLPRRVPVYLYRKEEGHPPEAHWGTMTAIFALEGCEPVTRSARLVDRKALDRQGFLPRGVSPDDV